MLSLFAWEIGKKLDAPRLEQKFYNQKAWKEMTSPFFCARDESKIPKQEPSKGKQHRPKLLIVWGSACIFTFCSLRLECLSFSLKRNSQASPSL